MAPSEGRRGSRDSDEDLLRLYVSGSGDAFREIVERHQQWLYGYLVNETRCPETARDLFQEVALRVARGAPRFGYRSRFSTWLFAIAANVLRDHRHRQFRERVRVFSAASVDEVKRRLPWGTPGDAEAAGIEGVADPRPGPDCEYESRERLARVRDALGELPEKQRRVLVLVKVEGLSIQAAAETLGLNVNTTKTLLRRGRLGLARRLAKGEGS